MHPHLRHDALHHRRVIVAKLKKLPGCAGIRSLTLRAR